MTPRAVPPERPDFSHLRLLIMRILACLTRVALVLAVMMTGGLCAADDGIEFFEKKIRPVLVEHCYACHSGESKELQGELRLDLKAGWEQGGESGSPAIVSGKPDESPLLKAMRHDADASAMPPKQRKLPEAVIADFAAWIARGAPDPREGEAKRRDKAADWEATYQSRINWWSLQPVAAVEPPPVQNGSWPRTEIDRFILAKIESQGLAPGAEADRRALARRLSFALTGLPPEREQVERLAADPSDEAYERFVDMLLESPHFGERWARHWMDVVHYADTHGYEWDVPAKNAWRYRDYLIRAFNYDLPYQQLVLEHLAGDLLPPRVDTATNVNEALIAPMSLRLGERRHGDSAAAEGVTQEAVSNMIDTLGKAFLGTTLACAQCHDHKLDAVEQKDYYSLAGMLMSTRFSARLVDTADPNVEVIDQLRELKKRLRNELASKWLEATDAGKPGNVIEKLKAIPADATPAPGFPATVIELWKRSLGTPLTRDEFIAEQVRRAGLNQSLVLLADFTRADVVGNWQLDGFGMKHGLAADGDFVVADEGDAALLHIVPAGRYSHLWSQRLAGSLQSPQLDPLAPIHFSAGTIGGKFPGYALIVDRCINSERLQFLNRPTFGWLSITGGNLDTLEGSIDKLPRRLYFEIATKALNNYFPARINYGGLPEAEETDPRSWFGVTKIYQHAPGQPPQDELARFAPLFEEANASVAWPERLALLLRGAIERWSRGEATAEDALLLQDAVQNKLLPNELAASPEIAALVNEYRAMEKKIQPDQTVGSVAEWNEGRNDPIGIRGSYTDWGDAVERGSVRFLGRGTRASAESSGRLEWARQIASEQNPLTARVYVNRVWHFLFGEGLVRTPDDFGHIGEKPTHPELLDYLASEFVRDGWSTKRLIRRLVTSRVWRQASVPSQAAINLDPENRLWHTMPMRRLEAEAIRDSILTVSGRIDPALYGEPIEPYRTAEDSLKRLYKGPLDGNGRRSIYLEMTLMEPPRFLAVFNQPLPKQTVGKRDVTNVPDQALALLNDPFVNAMAEHWSKQLLNDGAKTPDERASAMLNAAFSRPASPQEVARLVDFVRRTAELDGKADDLMQNVAAWKSAAHAVFNLKEFLYVR